MSERDDGPRVDNGLHAPKYVPLTDVDSAVGQHLLTALGRARIAAYLSDDAAGDDTDRQRLFVASDERVDARTIVAAAVRALGSAEDGPDGAGSGGGGGLSPVAGAPIDSSDPDTDAAFRALVADWRIDTVAAVRDAERDLTREDADWRARLGRAQASDEVWLDEDHYVPPPPPPLPRLAGPTIIGMFVMAVAILVLALGGYVGLAGDVSLVLGIGGLVVAAGIFFTRIHDHHRDEDDDGAAI